MHALVKNFRGISEGQIEIAPIALLCGKNGAGKTSMARAVAAAVTGKAVPWPGVTIKGCKVLLRRGTHTGSVMVGTQSDNTVVDWPEGSVRSIGTPPTASEVAVGLIDILSLKEEKALEYFITMLKADPTENDVKAAFATTGIGENVAAKIWEVIQAQGWKAALTRATETRALKKGAWQQITGQTWGEKKAAEYYPEGWEDSMATLTIEVLAAAITKAQAEVEKAVGAGAIQTAKMAELQKLSEKKGEYADAVELCTKEAAAAKAAFEAVEESLRNTPDPSSSTVLTCPHCNKESSLTPLHQGQYTLTKTAEIDKKTAKEMAVKRAGLCGERARLSVDKEGAMRALANAEALYDSAVAAEKVLKEAPPITAGGVAGAVEAARAKLEELQRNYKLVTQRQSANAANDQISVNQKIIDLLEEGGIRKTKLTECMEAFTSHFIDHICQEFGIPLVSINTNMEVEFGATSYSMLSASEQFRVRCVLQLAIAQVEGAGLVIIDGADILDNAGRSGLLRAVNYVGIPALVCMTLGKPDLAPDLSAMGVGRSYWVEAGACKPIGAERAAA